MRGCSSPEETEGRRESTVNRSGLRGSPWRYGAGGFLLWLCGLTHGDWGSMGWVLQLLGVWGAEASGGCGVLGGSSPWGRVVGQRCCFGVWV